MQFSMIGTTVRIFPSSPKINYRFRRVYAAYRIFGLLNDLGYAKAKDYRRQRHAFWNSLWVLHRGMDSKDSGNLSVEASRLKQGFDVIEKRRRTRKNVRALTREVWRAWRLGRKKDPELYTPNNFFKSKYGNQCILNLAFPRVRRVLKLLGRDLSTAY